MEMLDGSSMEFGSVNSWVLVFLKRVQSGRIRLVRAWNGLGSVSTDPCMALGVAGLYWRIGLDLGGSCLEWAEDGKLNWAPSGSLERT